MWCASRPSKRCPTASRGTSWSTPKGSPVYSASLSLVCTGVSVFSAACASALAPAAAVAAAATGCSHCNVCSHHIVQGWTLEYAAPVTYYLVSRCPRAPTRFLRVNFVDENMGRLPVPLSPSLRERYGTVQLAETKQNPLKNCPDVSMFDAVTMWVMSKVHVRGTDRHGPSAME